MKTHDYEPIPLDYKGYSLYKEVKKVFAADPLMDYAIHLHQVGMTSDQFGQATVAMPIDSTKRNRMINLLRDIELGFIKYPKKKRG